MRALVLAHGNGHRWNDRAGRPYLGVPKQLVVIDGETLLERTVRLLSEHTSDIVIVAPDDRFDTPGARRVALDEWDPCGCDMSKFVATAHLWATDARTEILWGDCYYTASAIDAIVGHDSDDVHYFRRPWPSKITGHRWDESFAVTFGPDHHATVLTAAHHVAALYHDGRLRATHIRTHYAATLGLPDDQLDDVNLLVDTPGQTVIDDLTDDFDFPHDYERWMAARVS